MNLNRPATRSGTASTVNFYRSGGGCRNTGEIAAVFDHEWGHGMDDNDAARRAVSNSSEGYADIAAIYRLQASCVGHGFFWTLDDGCGLTADGTGFNANESPDRAATARPTAPACATPTGRSTSDNTPDTALGFVCTHCSTGTGPCGRQVHCAAAPVAPGGLGPRRARPHRGALQPTTARPRSSSGNKLFYQGSGNIGLWHACTCGGSSSGCGATNGYMQWLAADDDNGNLNDGTPHMTAIFNAFNRHGIACATPAAQNSGCARGPGAARRRSPPPPGNYQVGARPGPRSPAPPATGSSAAKATPAATSARR